MLLLYRITLRREFTMSSSSNNDFSIHLDFSKNSKRPERVYQSMTNLTLAMKRLDSLLADSVSKQIKTHIVLNEIQGGSVVSSFKAIIKNIDDEDLRNMDAKRIFGKFLVIGKHKLLNQTNEIGKLRSIKDVTKIIQLIEELKNELNIFNSLNSRPISHQQVLSILQDISNAISILELEDTVEITGEGRTTPFNRKFILTDEDVESILTEKSETKRTTLPLKIKKPDYLGKSKWVFKSQHGQMEVKILDMDWLESFQKAKEVLLPGDSIKATIETVIAYDHQGAELSVNHSLIEVLDIIKGHNSIQMKLPY